MQKVLIIITLISVTAAGYSYMNGHRQSRVHQELVASLSAQLQRMEEHALVLEQRVLELEGINAQLQQGSVDTIIDKPNQNLAEKWSDVVEHFANEMDKLGTILERELGSEEKKDNKNNDDDDLSI